VPSRSKRHRVSRRARDGPGNQRECHRPGRRNRGDRRRLPRRGNQLFGRGDGLGATSADQCPFRQLLNVAGSPPCRRERSRLVASAFLRAALWHRRDPELLGADSRPLLATAIKPMGTSAEVFAEMVFECAAGVWTSSRTTTGSRTSRTHRSPSGWRAVVTRFAPQMTGTGRARCTCPA